MTDVYARELEKGEFRIDSQDMIRFSRSREAVLARAMEVKLDIVTTNISHGSAMWFFAVQHFMPIFVRAVGSMLERETRFSFWNSHAKNFGQGHREVEHVKVLLYEDAAEVLFYSHILFGAELTKQSTWMEYVYGIDFADTFSKFPLNVLSQTLENVALREVDGLLDCAMEMILYIIHHPDFEFNRIEREIKSV